MNQVEAGIQSMMAHVTEMELFYRFLEQKLQNGMRQQSLDDCLIEFRAYQQELIRFGKGLQQSLDESARGESAPLDVDELKKACRLPAA